MTDQKDRQTEDRGPIGQEDTWPMSAMDRWLKDRFRDHVHPGPGEATTVATKLDYVIKHLKARDGLANLVAHTIARVDAMVRSQEALDIGLDKVAANSSADLSVFKKAMALQAERMDGLDAGHHDHEAGLRRLEETDHVHKGPDTAELDRRLAGLHGQVLAIGERPDTLAIGEMEAVLKSRMDGVERDQVRLEARTTKARELAELVDKRSGELASLDLVSRLTARLETLEQTPATLSNLTSRVDAMEAAREAEVEAILQRVDARAEQALQPLRTRSTKALREEAAKLVEKLVPLQAKAILARVVKAEQRAEELSKGLTVMDRRHDRLTKRMDKERPNHLQPQSLEQRIALAEGRLAGVEEGLGSSRDPSDMDRRVKALETGKATASALGRLTKRMDQDVRAVLTELDALYAYTGLNRNGSLGEVEDSYLLKELAHLKRALASLDTRTANMLQEVGQWAAPQGAIGATVGQVIRDLAHMKGSLATLDTRTGTLDQDLRKWEQGVSPTLTALLRLTLALAQEALGERTGHRSLIGAGDLQESATALETLAMMTAGHMVSEERRLQVLKNIDQDTGPTVDAVLLSTTNPEEVALAISTVDLARKKKEARDVERAKEQADIRQAQGDPTITTPFSSDGNPDQVQANLNHLKGWGEAMDEAMKAKALPEPDPDQDLLVDIMAQHVLGKEPTWSSSTGVTMDSGSLTIVVDGVRLRMDVPEGGVITLPQAYRAAQALAESVHLPVAPALFPDGELDLVDLVYNIGTIIRTHQDQPVDDQAEAVVDHLRRLPRPSNPIAGPGTGPGGPGQETPTVAPGGPQGAGSQDQDKRDGPGERPSGGLSGPSTAKLVAKLRELVTAAISRGALCDELAWTADAAEKLASKEQEAEAVMEAQLRTARRTLASKEEDLALARKGLDWATDLNGRYAKALAKVHGLTGAKWSSIEGVPGQVAQALRVAGTNPMTIGPDGRAARLGAKLRELKAKLSLQQPMIPTVTRDLEWMADQVEAAAEDRPGPELEEVTLTVRLGPDGKLTTDTVRRPVEAEPSETPASEVPEWFRDLYTRAMSREETRTPVQRLRDVATWLQGHLEAGTITGEAMVRPAIVNLVALASELEGKALEGPEVPDRNPDLSGSPESKPRVSPSSIRINPDTAPALTWLRWGLPRELVAEAIGDGRDRLDREVELEAKGLTITIKADHLAPRSFNAVELVDGVTMWFSGSGPLHPDPEEALADHGLAVIITLEGCVFVEPWEGGGHG